MTTRGEDFEGAVIAAHKLARDQFEAFAGMDQDDLPDDETNAMQVRLMRWQVDLFGLQADATIALGVIEECGETFEAETADAALDGLGDTIVWSGQIAINNRMAIAPIIALAGVIVTRGPALPVLAVSRLAQCVVKRTQRVRGMDDDNAYRLRLASELAECIAYSWETVAICHTDQPVDAAAVYRIVGAEVLTRKRGDVMIPKAESVADLEMAAGGAIDAKAARKDQALANLVAANVALGEAEKIEGPGDFVVADEMRAKAAADAELAAIVGDAPSGRHPALGFDTGGDS